MPNRVVVDVSEVNIDDELVIKTLKEGFVSANRLFGRKQIALITDRRWAWDRETPQRGGTVETSPRDIVDTGALRNSYQMVLSGDDTICDHTYNIVYAAAVHNGAVFKNGRTMIARPWLTVAQREFDFEASFAKIVQPKIDRLERKDFR